MKVLNKTLLFSSTPLILIPSIIIYNSITNIYKNNIGYCDKNKKIYTVGLHLKNPFTHVNKIPIIDKSENFIVYLEDRHIFIEVSYKFNNNINYYKLIDTNYLKSEIKKMVIEKIINNRLFINYKDGWLIYEYKNINKDEFINLIIDHFNKEGFNIDKIDINFNYKLLPLPYDKYFLKIYTSKNIST